MTHRPPFTAIAGVYDEVMADVDYDGWCDFILEVARERGFSGGRVLDLGCGTGNMTLRLAARGLQVTGVDGSAEMLERARSKAPQLDFVQARFTDFELPERFELVVSVFDSLNNLLEPQEFLGTARRVLRHLEPGGLFLFDMNTRVGLEDLWEQEAVEGWAGDIHYRWEHSFDPVSGLARVEAYFDDGEREFTEVHFERPYEADELEGLLSEAGFERIEAFTYPPGEMPVAEAERIWLCARRPL